jgi:hypothetical protein
MAAFSAPAIAQNSSYTPGNYWTFTGIDVVEGQEENYSDWLATQWRSAQEFALAQGWIEEYHVLWNTHPRDGEPDLWLVVEFEELASRAEQQARQEAYEEYIGRNVRQLTTESGERTVMRRPMGTSLTQEADLIAPE